MNISKKESHPRQNEQVFCPYCSSAFPSAKIMSKHVDDLHIGKGLLEGNMRKL